jgi:hypothetical protein
METIGNIPLITTSGPLYAALTLHLEPKKGTYNMSDIVTTAEVLPALPVLQSKDKIKSGQDKIRLSLVKLDNDVHEVAFQCILHAYKHGDTSLMTRLLVDILDPETGYRRRGLIEWMRSYTPMELKKDTINLSGTDGQGNKRPWRLEEAYANPFRKDTRFAETVKPVFRDNLMNKIDAAYREFTKAIDNTLNRQPIDPAKPFYDGIHTQKVIDFFEKVKALKEELPADETRAVRVAQQQQRELADFVKANEEVLKA